MTLLTPLSHIVDASRAKALRDQRGIDTVEDLLWFMPRRYLDRQGDVTELHEGEYVVVVGEVIRASTRRMTSRRGSIHSVTIRTSTGEIDVAFFRSFGHSGRLVPGAVGLFAGTVGRYRGRAQLAHPRYELFRHAGEGGPGFSDPDLPSDAGLGLRELYPVYLEVKGADSWTISGIVEAALLGLEDTTDPLPDEIRAMRGMPTFVQAMRWVHLPDDRAQIERGRDRLKYDEALVMQLVLAMRRREQERAQAVPRTPRPGGLLETFDERLPFALTRGQREVGEQIAADLGRTHPMHRLLQGEVGSGKTVVALRAMLAVVDAGGQAALLAPTEVLAAQHHRSIMSLLGELAERGLLGGTNDLEHGTRVALLTGSQSAAARKSALLAAASGEAGIVVGTHALIQKHVQLADLGLVVVDEQHRFGVEQRDALRGKAASAPHMLVMTATPIPRTVAMTVFGDMETSTLRELPPGRSPVASHVVDNARWYERAWGRVAEEVRAGHQAYVVCPRIGDDAPTGDDAGDDVVSDEEWERAWDALAGGGVGGSGRQTAGAAGSGLTRPELRAVVDVLAELRGRDDLAHCRIEMLHGRLPADEKDAIMTAFAAGEIDVLVSTTVIEVGVDVPNATVMVVLDADRFGISQLHQLRGRVGRGDAQGLCLLVATGADRPPPRARAGWEPVPPVSPEALERLRAVAATSDGFELARLDLTHRREGDILGARQSGGSSLRLLSLRGSGDERIIEQAREDAGQLLAAAPDLTAYPELAYLVATLIDEEQAAFLERG